MISKILAPVAAILFGSYVIVSVLTSSGNTLSEAMIYLAILGFIIGAINAKAGMIFVFLCGDYLDVLKRFLVVGGSYSFQDVIRTLAVAPVATGAVFMGIMIQYLTKRDFKLPWIRLALSGVLALGVIAASFSAGNTGKELLQIVANSALYVGLVAFAALIYRQLDEQHKLFRILTLIFIPVVVYGWVQLINGYNTIEEEYARSGLTIIVNPLIHPSEVEYKRIFSTMNSSVAYTMVGTILGIYALIFGFGKSLAKRSVGILFAIALFASHVPGAGRTGWAVAVVTFICYFIFQSRITTITTYVTAVLSITVFLFNAKTIGEWLVENSGGTATTEFEERAFNMGTFTARTEGIAEWIGHKEYFSWFGLPKEETVDSRAHDMIGQIYVTTGAVGLAFSVIFGAGVLFYLHKNLLAITVREEKKIGAFYLANIFAVIIGGIFSGSQLHVFPVNLYFWSMAGLLFQLIAVNKARLAEQNLLERRHSESSPELVGSPQRALAR